MRRALVLALLAAAFVPLRARAQTITAAPGGEMSSVVGMSFSVPVYVDMTARPEKLGSFAARLRWNPAVLQLTSNAPGSFGTITLNEDSLASGVVRLAGVNPAGAGGLITLVNLQFTPLVAQPDTVHLSVTELFAAGTFADLTGGSLTVRNGYYCPARGRLGDIDNDGNINSRDALIALSNAVGLDVSAFDITLGDVDASGTTNARDALIILSSAVGLPVGGFRVGAMVGGSCALNAPVALAIVPNVVDVLVGQTVTFEARASEGGGALQTVADATWRSGNASALAVYPDGHAVAHDTGTFVVMARRGALDSAQATVHVAPWRTRHIVDIAAANAKNQLGSAAFPFASIQVGSDFAHDGDTVEVRPGRYDASVSLDHQVVLMGDTLPDGTRPLIAVGSDGGSTGIQLNSPGSAEVHDLAIDGYTVGVDLDGPTRVLLHGLRGTHLTWGVVVDGDPVANVRIEASRFAGNGANGYQGDGVLTNAYVDTLVVQGTEISDFALVGIIAGGTDSLAVLKSQVHDVGYYGLLAGPNPGDCYACEDAPPVRPARAPGRAYDMAPPTPAVVVDSSSIVRAGYRVAYLEDTRSAVFSHSRLGGSEEYGVAVYGNGHGWLRFVGDSIQAYAASYYNWLNANNLDSLAVDSAYVTAYYGDAYNVNLIRVTNTQFANASGNPLSVSFGGSHAGGQVFLDNVSLTGDPHCDLCGDGFDFGPSAVVVNRLTAVNLYRGIYANGDSSLTVTHSLFRHVERPLYWNVSSNDTLSRLMVTNTTFSGFGNGIEANTGAVVVDSNTFENGGGTAIYVDNQAPARITRNRIAGVNEGMEVYSWTSGRLTDTIADNVVAGLANNYGIYADGSDTTSFQILRNTLACSGPGANDATGIRLENASGLIGSNQVLGCRDGIDVSDDGSPPRTDSVAANTLSVPANAYGGIRAEGSLRSRIVGNAVTGDTTGSQDYGDIYVYGYQPGATATIDSNVVTGGTTSGIYVTYLDTALVRYNTVQSVVAPEYYRGGIVTDGSLTYLVRLYGNVVRHIHGNGMRIWNSDTAMVQVDSNLVSGSDTVGIRLDGGADSVTRNRIVNNGTGVEFASYSVDQSRSLLSGNNIVGNLFGLMQGLDAYYQAPNNWWGDAKGPRCVNVEVQVCDPTSLGDSVSSFGVAFTPFALTEFGTTPPLSVRAFPKVALRAPAVSTARRVSTTGLDAPLMSKVRTERAVALPTVRAPRALTAARVPAGLGAARSQAWQRMLEGQATAATVRAQRDAQVASARTERLAARAAQERQLEQRKTQRESARAAIVAKRAARAAQSAHGVRP